MPASFMHLQKRLVTQLGAKYARVFTSDKTGDAPLKDAVTRTEELEHIAVYARAGYFNMGYTVDAFHAPPH